MSRVDPQSRWWNKDSTRKIAAYVCWIVAILFAFVGMWSMMLGEGSPLPLGVGLLGSFLPIPMLIGGTFLLAFGTEKELDTRFIVWPLALYFVASGIGALVGSAMSPRGFETANLWFLLFILGGIVTILIFETVRLRSSQKTDLQSRVRRSGATTSGVVTRARSYSVNYQPVTKVTVRFADTEGRTRWTSTTMPGNVSTGERMRVQYLQDDPGRRGAVVLSRTGGR